MIIYSAYHSKHSLWDTERETLNNPYAGTLLLLLLVVILFNLILFIFLQISPFVFHEYNDSIQVWTDIFG